VAKLRAGQVAFDVLVPTYDILGKLIQGNFLRPLNHSYSPKQVWPAFQNPWYDQGWNYSVPYTIYTTGIAWRVDKVKDDIAKLPVRGPVGRAVPRQGRHPRRLPRGHRHDPAQERHHRPQHRQPGPPQPGPRPAGRAGQDGPAAGQHQDYIDLPEAKTWITQAWSGDMVNSQYYMPKGQSADVMRYWFPADGKGPVNNDMLVLLRTGKNPVLGHLFLNHLLDYDVAVDNMSWNGYQPPQNKLNPTQLVSKELLPPNLKPATVLPAYFESGFRELELPGEVDDRWHAVWQEFKAGA
jgi:spermidine/putrescine transport system substrate-binding protein